MKKIKIINIPAKPKTTIQKTIYVCDLCGKESDQGGSFRECCLCGRLCCRNLTENKSCIYCDPHEIGDYPDLYCKICYDLTFKKYWEIRQGIEESRDEELEKLKEKIKKESLSAKEEK